MARYYTYYTDQGRVATVHATQAAADTSASGDSTRTAQQGAANDIAVEPGWFRAANGNVSATQVVSDAAQRTAIKAAAAAHGNLCLDMMKPGWVLNDGGGTMLGAPSADGSASCWRNTYYWIVSPVACIAAACDSPQTAVWTLEVCEGLWAAYQRMVPAVEERIAFWYRNHDDGTWRGYVAAGASGAGAGRVRPHWRASRTSLGNAFASDAGTATAWDGNDNTLALTIPEHATPSELIA